MRTRENLTGRWPDRGYMAGFEENDLYEAFGLEQPKEGGNDPKPAEPGAEVQEQGEEPGADSAHEPPEGQELSQKQEEPEDQDGGGAGEQEEPPEDGGGKPAQQTKEQRAENARAGGRRSRRRPSRPPWKRLWPKSGRSPRRIWPPSLPGPT